MEPSSSKNDKRSIPFEDTEGEQAFELASRIVYERKDRCQKSNTKERQRICRAYQWLRKPQRCKSSEG
jgi:hypothetical protein